MEVYVSYLVTFLLNEQVDSRKRQPSGFIMYFHPQLEIVG